MSDAQPDRDAAIHARIVAGEMSAVAEWEGLYRDRLIAYAIRKGLSAEDAEEAFSDAFFATMRRASTLHGPLGLSLRKHAFGVVGHKIADFHRKAADHAESLDKLIEADPAVRLLHPAPPSIQPDARIVEAVRRCLETIKASYRVLLELLYYEGLPAEAVAELLGVEVNTVYKAKGRAISRIAPCLEEALGVQT
jgi:RNA polymerase sigma factor (sigma-70 family)